MYSAYDPPSLGSVPFSAWWQRRGPGTWRVLYAFMRLATAHWLRSVAAERRRLGLPPARGNPLMDLWTPGLNLALFSPLFGAPQPDWPADTVVTGFPLYDGPAQPELPAALRAYLDAGDPPIVFTLGSAAVFDAGTFYADAARVAASMGARAVLLTGLEAGNPVPRALLTEAIFTCDYAPHGELFPRAAAIVHQGGIGTTARALAAGRPMLVMPYSHDQPDNARRCVRLGVARVVEREHWSARRAERELRELLGTASHAAAARDVGARLAGEHGASAAADAIERRLAAPAG